MYCTGGIRCELYSALLLEKGFKEVYQLDGGVIAYGLKWEQENGEVNSLFSMTGWLCLSMKRILTCLLLLVALFATQIQIPTTIVQTQTVTTSLFAVSLVSLPIKDVVQKNALKLLVFELSLQREETNLSVENTFVQQLNRAVA